MTRRGEQVEHLAGFPVLSSHVAEGDWRSTLLLTLLTPARRGIREAGWIGGVP
jgi:hypothetical protein